MSSKQYAFVGLGNPGEKYQQTRHNVGFLFIDYLASYISNRSKDTPFQSTNFEHDKYLNAEILKIDYTLHPAPCTFIFAKPQTYMNRSGESVAKLITNYELPITNLIIVHDDLDITFGKFKIQPSAGPKVHNGLASIEQHLKTAEFTRVRIGVDNRDGDRSLSGEQYVLSTFRQEEQNEFEDIFQQITTRLLQDLKI